MFTPLDRAHPARTRSSVQAHIGFAGAGLDGRRKRDPAERQLGGTAYREHLVLIGDRRRTAAQHRAALAACRSGVDGFT